MLLSPVDALVMRGGGRFYSRYRRSSGGLPVKLLNQIKLTPHVAQFGAAEIIGKSVFVKNHVVESGNQANKFTRATLTVSALVLEREDS